MYFNEFYTYSEKLISAQFNVSEIIAHELTKGEVREEFVIEALRKGFGNPINLKRGFLQIEDFQSSQMDILLLEKDSIVAQIGSQTIVDPRHCKMVLEVKGNATGSDIKKYNDNIGRIKNKCPKDLHPLYGIFCYRVKLTEKTIMNRFGFTFDQNTLTYYDEYNKQKSIRGLEITYPNIDFFISVEVCDDGTNKQLFLRKNEVNGRYIRSVEFPVIKNLFSLTHSLLIT